MLGPKAMEKSDAPFAAPVDPKHRLRRRRRRICCIVCLLVLVLLAVAATALALTIFKVRDPSTDLVSVRLLGVSPRISFPVVAVEINITLDLAVRVHNPNYAAFAHGDDGHTRLFYRGAEIGDAAVAAGRIPARGSETIHLLTALEVDRIMTDLGPLFQDIIAGAVAIDAVARLPGRVTVFGFVRLHAVATSRCHVVLAVANLTVISQECTHSTRL
ncbi:uncharacterized protein LOC122013866 [Zingiber officinale]|uniref:Late embryogenesis abundant protein LEA-2 subgroup domain-containing protein n=1 Tax=Zingiber officinale TaxID=94328 RepID=A0A8J5IB73_ZINOF|nr:uncharacterized protein LOC122013866 [Zingiber officinale]KAG6539188.1 hypothetical protein ZIOFF_004341 [Zingiber officinale]